MSTLLFLAACQVNDNTQSSDSLEVDGGFSTAIPFGLEKIPAGSTLTAELVIDGGAAIAMTVIGDLVRVTTSELSAGSHTFSITYFLDGKRIALAESSATIIAGQTTALTFDISQFDQDLDKDGVSGIDEVLAGSNPDDAASKPPQAPNGVINTPTTDLTIFPGQSVNFGGTATDPDNNTPFTFVWNFGGGATNSSLEDPGPVTFNTLGTFTITFTVSDSTGLSDPTPETRTITVTAPATGSITIGPTSLNFGNVEIGNCKTAIFAIQHVLGTGSVSGSVSISPNPPFSIISGSTFNVSGSDGPLVSIRFCPSSASPFTGSATVSSNGIFTGTSVVGLNGTGTAPNQAPNGVMNAPATDQVILKGQGLTFNGSGTDPEADPVSFLWNFGSGAADNFFADPGLITFATTGLFPVRMTATDSLGLADPTPAYRVVGVANQRKLSATRIAAGDSHTCAIVDDGAVKCWGSNFSGQLGLGDLANRGDQAGEMRDNLSSVSLGDGRSALAISTKSSHTCALLDNASVKCWGQNDFGQLGQGDTVQRGDGTGEMGDNLSAVSLGTARSALAITTGFSHTCALLDDTSVKCWGSNNTAQLGQGDLLSRGDEAGEMGDNLLAVSLGTGRTARAISSGLLHTCVLLDDASVKCWGINSRGELGQGDTVQRGDGAGEMGDNLSAVSLGTGRSALAISSGDFHTCALLDDANVKCWGLNGFGQLGQGDTANRGDSAGEMGDNLSAVSLGTGHSALAISAEGFHTCVLLDDASVKCWGSNNSGQLGQGDILSRGDDAGEMGDNLSVVSLGTGRSALAIFGGNLHTCALLHDASVKCWGQNDSGQLGQGDALQRGDNAGEMGDNLSAVSLGTGHSALAISAGTFHTCAFLDSASVKCWGGNTFGQLGQSDALQRGDNTGEMGDNLSAVSLGTGRSSLAISAGNFHTCALLDDASVKCWGHNTGGQLGQGDTLHRGRNAGEMGDNLSAVSLGTGRSSLAISAGNFHTCALLDDASVKCWGFNNTGQLGQGNTASRGDNAGEMGDNLSVVSLGTGRSALAISAGDSHTCALLDDASVKCWGDNSGGQLGQGDILRRGDGAEEMGDNLLAVSLGAGRSALAISAGGIHTCALLDDASVKCWGFNNTGQLGQGDTASRGDGAGEMGDNLLAVSLGSGRSVLALAAGVNHTCVILDDASIKCWGINVNGQLGQGDTVQRGDDAGEMGDNLLAVSFGSGRSVLALAAGVNHTCAILDDASIKCWGINVNGQLGQGDVADRGDAPNEMGKHLFPIPLGILGTP